ncbi:Trifunctional NAD biosynthesis/regulator protein NadR [Arsenophonus endosymbiont of Bemisia tabaci Q2]|nr:Trifunctional NAD biosynthesis/regulator protein NadR [Arsenophonus endosymbiont of Bemisia tabaci Q2]
MNYMSFFVMINLVIRRFYRQFDVTGTDSKRSATMVITNFQISKNIYIHSFDEQGIEPYPQGWEVWSEGMKKFLMAKNIQPQFIYSGEVDDIAHYKNILVQKWYLLILSAHL